jgi:hypothetical protein
MDDRRIAFKVHRRDKIAQEVARKKCFLGASGAGAKGIALRVRRWRKAGFEAGKLQVGTTSLSRNFRVQEREQ